MSGLYYLSTAGERWPADLAGAIARFEYEAGLNRVGRMTLSIRNDGLIWQDYKLLGEGNDVVAQFGTADRTIRRTLMVHQVRGIDPITVPAYAGDNLGAGEHWRLYENATYSDVAIDVARRHGLDPDVRADPVRRPQIAQAGESDGRLLARLAGEIGWEFWVDDRTLRFGPPDYGAKPVAILARGQNLAIFEPQEQTLMEPGEVVVRTFNIETKEFAELVVTDRTANRTLLGPGALRTPATGRQVSGTARQDRAAAVAEARGRFEILERQAVTVRFRSAGDTQLMPGAIVEVQGYGTRWDGLYRVGFARHSVSGVDYKVDGILLRNGAGRVGDVPATSAPVNTHRAQSGRPLATVRVIDLATGQIRKEEAT